MWDDDVGDDQLMALVSVGNSPVRPSGPPSTVSTPEGQLIHRSLPPTPDAGATAAFQAEVLGRLQAMEERLTAMEQRLEANTQRLEQVRTEEPATRTPGEAANRTQGEAVAPARVYTPADFGVDSATPLTKIMRECDEDNLPVERAMTMCTCKMADVLFTPRTLRRSSLQGRDDTEPLDTNRLGVMMRRLKGHFGQRCASDAQFRSIWKRCRQSLSAKCKHLRKSAVRSLTYD